MGIRKHKLKVIIGLAIVTAGALASRLLVQNDSSSATPQVTQKVWARVEKRELTTSLRLAATYKLAKPVDIAFQKADDGSVRHIVTGKIPNLGDTVRAGNVIAEINYRPIILVTADIPLFRNLRPGDSGGDVSNIQDGLRSMGFSISKVENGKFGPSTRTALESMYRAAGYEAPYTQGSREATLSKIQRATADLQEAQRAVDSAQSLGEDPKASLDRYREALDQLELAKNTEGAMLILSEVATIPSSSMIVGSLGKTVGQEVTDGAVLMSLTSEPLQIQATITSAQAKLIDGGARVSVISQQNCSLGEVVKAVQPESPTESNVENGDKGASSQLPAQVQSYDLMLPVKCEPAPDLKLLGQSTIVAVTTVYSKADSLVVPATALVYGADGSVSIVLNEHEQDLRVPVSVEAEADGFAAISSDSKRLREGERVLVGT